MHAEPQPYTHSSDSEHLLTASTALTTHNHHSKNIFAPREISGVKDFIHRRIPTINNMGFVVPWLLLLLCGWCEGLVPRLRCQTHWTVTESSLVSALSEVGEVSVLDFVSGPTRVKAECDLVFADASCAFDALARTLEVEGRRCRISRALTVDARRSPEARRRREPRRSAHHRSLLECAASDDRGPSALPARDQAVSRSTVLAALESLDDAGDLCSPEALAVAVAALVAVDENQRANALYETIVDHTSAMVRGAGIAAKTAIGDLDEALRIAAESKDDLDKRGFNSAIAAAEAKGDYTLAFELLQRRAKAEAKASSAGTFHREALRAKKSWLELRD